MIGGGGCGFKGSTGSGRGGEGVPLTELNQQTPAARQIPANAPKIAATPPPPPPICSRAELEERCRFLLAADDILEAEGLDVEASGVDEEVQKAKAEYAARGLDGFDEDAFRAEAAERLRYLAAMEFLQGAVKINVVPAAGASGKAPAATAAA